jgi:EmrB/QacA subfamily drug resistance transporter
MTSTRLSASPARTTSTAESRRWLALAFIALAQLMVALDATVVNIALPSAQAALRFADGDRQWVISAYTLAFGGLLLLGGRIADSASVGRRRALLTGLVGFGVASAISGSASTLGMLLGARALQGAFAALLAPSALSLLAVMFTEPHERAKAFGIYGAIAASGGAIGLLLGGLLTQYLDWRWCLYVNVPIALVAALGARTVLAESPRAHGQVHAQGFDIVGLLLGSGGLVALVSGCAQAAAQGWGAPLVLILLASGVVALGLFVRQEAHARAPLLPLRIVLDRQRGGAYLSALLAVAAMFGAFLFLTYELQVVLGFAPFQAGLAFLPMSASTFVVAIVLAPRLLPRVSPRVLLVPGFLIAAAGMLTLTQLQAGSAYLTGVLPAEILLGLGIASVMVPAASLATGGVDPRDAGIASATLNSAQQVGASLGTALLNTLAASVTAAYLTAHASAARADGLVHGYAAAAGLGALLLLAGAVISASLGRKTLHGTHRQEAGADDPVDTADQGSDTHELTPIAQHHPPLGRR